MRTLGVVVAAIVATWGVRSIEAAPPVTDVDSDGDGLSDFDEVHKYFTDPHKKDSDGDGKPDGDADERREFTYSIRLVVEHMPPADAITDAWQDARVISRSPDAVTIEIVAYPFADPQAESPDAPDRRSKRPDLAAFTKPNLTCDFDAATTADLRKALRADGIDEATLGDRALVEKVSTWAFARSHTVDIGFTSFCVTSRNGHLGIEPGLEGYVAEAREKKPRSDGPMSVPDVRSVEQQLDAEVRGRAMIRERVHGTCTSSGVYLSTILRALGVPTRTTIAMPPADGGDAAQVDMLRKGLRPSALRDAILEGPHAGWLEHTFNVVHVGGRWRRLNYTRLDQPIVDREYLGLMLRILDYDDLATSGVSATWGKKWALRTSSPKFPNGNPYRLVEVSDLLGPHAELALPPPAPPSTR